MTDDVDISGNEKKARELIACDPPIDAPVCLRNDGICPGHFRVAAALDAEFERGMEEARKTMQAIRAFEPC
jgi:hypothetical protein